MGLKSKSFGNHFEVIFERACRAHPGMAITRVPDGCRQLSNWKIIRVQTPFDWIVTYQGKTALIDTKTLGGKYFPISQVTWHQLQALRYHEKSGAIAGYVIWLREPDLVIFVNAYTLEDKYDLRTSIYPGDLGALELGKAYALGSFGPEKIFETSK